MQINGVGSQSTHNHNMHQVTGCMHEHNVSKKEGGAAASSFAGNTLQSDVSQYKQQQGQFSLTSWLKNTLAGGKKLLLKIWGEGSETESVDKHSGESIQKDTEQVMAQVGDPDEGVAVMGQHTNIAAQEAAAGSVVQPQSLHNNPYFSTIEDTGRQKQSMLRKMRIRFRSLTGQLTKQFSGRNTFQTKQQKPKEDLRRHSRYRQDDLEIDCILTDDSYLMDSYDRKGEYSKLSTKK